MNYSLKLDDACGRHFTFRDLIECGTTFKALQPFNVPKQLATFKALELLAKAILDPLSDTFGKLELTYGFASPELTRKIPRRIAPSLDQHVSHELDKNGNLCCKRGGAAVDFRVTSQNALKASQWIVQNCAFDRLYLYGLNRSLHVSHSLSPSRSIVIMIPHSKSRGLIPRSIQQDKFSKITTNEFLSFFPNYK